LYLCYAWFISRKSIHEIFGLRECIPEDSRQGLMMGRGSKLFSKETIRRKRDGLLRPRGLGVEASFNSFGPLD